MLAIARSVRTVAVAVLGATAMGCGTSQVSAPTARSTTGVPQSTTTTTLPAPTTTTVAIPVAPQPGAEAAANALVSAWSSGNQPVALSVATSQAVATLFAVPYPSGLAISRGCTSAFPPIVCTFGPPGGGPTNAPIFQVYVSQVPAGWYVSSIMIER
jgi:hypothetical protein